MVQFHDVAAAYDSLAVLMNLPCGFGILFDKHARSKDRVGMQAAGRMLAQENLP
jgi:hypothetical protein